MSINTRNKTQGTFARYTRNDSYVRGATQKTLEQNLKRILPLRKLRLLLLRH